MVRIKLVKRKIKNPTGYFSQEFIPAICPGCGMTFGYTLNQFRNHVVNCPECSGKIILLDMFGGLKLTRPED